MKLSIAFGVFLVAFGTCVDGAQAQATKTSRMDWFGSEATNDANSTRSSSSGLETPSTHLFVQTAPTEFVPLQEPFPCGTTAAPFANDLEWSQGPLKSYDRIFNYNSDLGKHNPDAVPELPQASWAPARPEKFAGTDIYVPNTFSQPQRDKIENMWRQLQEVCPYCMQAPLVDTNPYQSPLNTERHTLVGTGIASASTRPYPTYQHNPECPGSKVFNSQLAICVDPPTDECDAPGWIDKGIATLEKIVAAHSIEISPANTECRKQYFMVLIEAVDKQVRE